MKKNLFKKGDKIRLLRVPQSVFDMPPEFRDGVEGTLTAFQMVLNSNKAYKVIEVDKQSGWPWIEFTVTHADGIKRYHRILIEPDCVYKTNA